MTIYINIEDFTRWNKLVTEGKKKQNKKQKTVGCDSCEVSKIVKVTEIESRMVKDRCCWEGEMERCYSA